MKCRNWRIDDYVYLQLFAELPFWMQSTETINVFEGKTKTSVMKKVKVDINRTRRKQHQVHFIHCSSWAPPPHKSMTQFIEVNIDTSQSNSLANNFLAPIKLGILNMECKRVFFAIHKCPKWSALSIQRRRIFFFHFLDGNLHLSRFWVDDNEY